MNINLLLSLLISSFLPAFTESGKLSVALSACLARSSSTLHHYPIVEAVKRNCGAEKKSCDALCKDDGFECFATYHFYNTDSNFKARVHNYIAGYRYACDYAVDCGPNVCCCGKR